MTLSEHLSACYSAKHGKNPGSAVSAFVVAVKEDPGLRAAAEARRAELDDKRVTRKCYCSTAHRDILTDVLQRAA